MEKGPMHKNEKIGFFSVLIIASATFSFAAAADRPNVIVIMADDLGAEGLNAYGSTIYTTPRLDQMAAEGVLFNNAYSTPLCTPTRVMIMSGLYPNRTGYKSLINKSPGCRMPAEIKTFGHYFKDAGYKTAIAGKWQLGKFDEFMTIEQEFDINTAFESEEAEKKPRKRKRK